jgi:hypothetical protein
MFMDRLLFNLESDDVVPSHNLLSGSILSHSNSDAVPESFQESVHPDDLAAIRATYVFILFQIIDSN